MKIQIEPFPPNAERPYERPYEHLEPIVEALIKAGNEPTRDIPFYMDRDGWRCDLKRPIDFKLLKEKFEFPKSILLLEEKDAIFCQNSWIEIKGSVGYKAL